MLDVHPPHEPVHGIRDFLLHILTITIGLLIALGLEGLVERYEHHHLVHEAEASLHREIADNAHSLPDALKQITDEQNTLKRDAAVLNYVVKNKRAPENSSTTVNFTLHTINEVNWRTAQVSGAVGYMGYAEAQQFADIYDTQEELNEAQRQAGHDAIAVIAAFGVAEDSNGPDPFQGEAAEIRDKVNVLRGDLLLVQSLYGSLDKGYQHYLAGNHAD